MAKYKRQLTARAKMNPVPKEIYEAISGDIKSGNLTFDQIVERKAPSQLVALICAWDAAIEMGMEAPGAFAGIADDILYNLATSIRRYRAEAYPLSERQVQVIWNHLCKWLRVEAKTW